MLRKSFSMIIILLLVFSTSFVCNAENSSLEIRVSSQSILLNEEITVDIIAKNITDVAGADIIINYDSEKLSYHSKTFNLAEGDYIDLQTQGEILSDSEGKTRIAFGLKENASLLTGADIILATITYTATGIGEGSFSIDGSSCIVISDGSGGYVYDNVLLPETSTSINIFKKGSISGNITLSDGKSSQGKIIELYSGDIQIASTNVNVDGTYTFSGLDDGSYTIKTSVPGYEDAQGSVNILNGSDETLSLTLSRIKEDVNMDGNIGLEDLVVVANLFGLTDGQQGFNDDADVNNDGIIDILDLIYIMRKIQ